MIEKYEIIESDIQELPEIVAVNTEIFQNMYREQPYSLEHYQQKLSDKKAIIFVAKINGEIVGDSICFEKDESLYIRILGVKKEHRNKGIATKSLDLTENFARENKYTSVTSKVYNVSQDMLRLFAKRGYEITEIEQDKEDEKYNAIHVELKV